MLRKVCTSQHGLPSLPPADAPVLALARPKQAASKPGTAKVSKAGSVKGGTGATKKGSAKGSIKGLFGGK